MPKFGFFYPSCMRAAVLISRAKSAFVRKLREPIEMSMSM